MKRIFALWASVMVTGSAAFGQDVPPAFEASGQVDDAGEPDGYDPFDPTINAPKLIRIQVEYIEMAHKDLTRLMMADKAVNADATALRMKVQELVEIDEVKVIETQILICRSGQKATTESVHEYIFPTEYEPLCCPTTQEGEEKAKPPESGHSCSPPIPTAFETKNIGSMFVAEPTIGEDSKTIDLRFYPELVWHTGDTVWDESKDELGNLSKITMPDFYKVTINTSITCITGQHTMVGVVSPKDSKGGFNPDRKIMIFVKCDILPVIP